MEPYVGKSYVLRVTISMEGTPLPFFDIRRPPFDPFERRRVELDFLDFTMLGFCL